MASEDRKHKKRLKEAERMLIKMNRLRTSGKITKEEFIEALRPYKDELIELGYPVKGKKPKEKEKTEEEEVAEVEEAAVLATSLRWKRVSDLTIEEIEERIDKISSGTSPSDSLSRLYRERYGEELAPPEDGVVFTVTKPDDRGMTDILPDGDITAPEAESVEKKRFGFKSLFSKSKSEG